MRVLLDELREGPLVRGCMSGDYPYELHMDDRDSSGFADSEAEIVSFFVEDYPLGELTAQLLDQQSAARRAWAVSYATAMQLDVIARKYGDDPVRWATLPPHAQRALRADKGSPRYLTPKWEWDIPYVVVASTLLRLKHPMIPSGAHVALVDDLSDSGLIETVCMAQAWRYIVDGVTR